MSKEQVKKQCVFTSYHPINRNINYGKYRYEQGDLLIAKEKWIGEDGQVHKNIRTFENHPRPFWITKKRLRTYKDKREWAYKHEVDMFKTPQWNLSYAIQKSLGKFNPDPKMQVRMVNRDPYVFGTDLSPTFLLKEAYNNKYDYYKTGRIDVCKLDIETDVVNGAKDEIIMCSLTLNKKHVSIVRRDFLFKHSLKGDQEFFEILDKDIPQVRGEWGYHVLLKVVETEMDVIRETFNILHTWKPDVVAGWNVMMFDQMVIAKRIEENGEDPAMYFSDPSIPDKYKGYKFREGKKFAISDSGKKTNLKPIDRWHEVIAPASFIWIDGMCVYYRLRKIKGMLPSYSLDYISKLHLKGMGKYEIEAAEKYRGLRKHFFMQTHYPVHYAVYNLVDTIIYDRLDNETKDLCSTFFDLLGNCDYRDYQSNPNKAVCNFHTYIYRNKNAVIGSTSDTMFNEWDKQLPPLDGWIVALDTTYIHEQQGLKCVKEYPYLHTRVFSHCADSDIRSSYPWGIIFMNVSRRTTKIEISQIQGVIRYDRYTFGLNLIGGRVNSVSNARIGFGLPDFDKSLKTFDMHYEMFKAARLDKSK